MRRYLISAVTITCIWIASASPALAQGYDSSAGWNAGVLINTGLNDGAATGDSSVELKPDMTWLVSIHYDRWFGTGNVGFRARGGFSRPTLPWVQGDREIRVLMGDIGLMLRPIAPGPDKTVLPFVSGGVGFINWGLGDGPATTFDQAGANYPGEEKFNLVASASLGFDILTPWHWGEGPLIVRLEGRDHIQFSSPFDPANPDDAEFGLIHNAGVVIGFHTGIGVLGGG
ncbi:MAG: hypothetical protein HKO65_12190 [Gemmatimonadetes bacterium]|nr:hypothetical protein [Gemmatimonadota bacterium]NNM05840.1 hypothetical protein [Gemmatimonadota bacterium]